MSPKLHILYEDNHIIAVEKPAGVLIDDLMEETKKFLKEKYSKPGNVFLGMVHQLDRPVSGIVLFGKTSKGAARLSEQFRDREAAKIYHAWVEGDPGQARTIKNFLKKDENRRKAFIYDKEVRDSKPAELDFSVVKKVLSPKGIISLVKVRLKTGRFHQIRAQLGRIGHPVVGDVKYGSKIHFPDSHIALAATSITFKTATGANLSEISEGIRSEGEVKTLTVPAPEMPVL
jgi:23S rRNA pseudouridine1911/1915/1917 synthase